MGLLPKPILKLYPFLGGDGGLVLCRTRRNTWGTIGWDLRSDTFTIGQWMKARVYAHRCDLSPDGRHFVYFAYKPWESPPWHIRKHIAEYDDPAPLHHEFESL